MSIADELALTWTREPMALYVFLLSDDDSLRQALLLDRLSSHFGKPVVALGRYLFRCVEITSEYRDELAELIRLALLGAVADAMLPEPRECAPHGPFPRFAYKDSGNRAREALWRGEFARRDAISQRVRLDIEDRLRRENSGAE